MLMQSWKEYQLVVINDLNLKKIKTIDSKIAEYGFGSNQDTSRVYICQSDKNGYKIYEIQVD